MQTNKSNSPKTPAPAHSAGSGASGSEVTTRSGASNVQPFINMAAGIQQQNPLISQMQQMHHTNPSVSRATAPQLQMNPIKTQIMLVYRFQPTNYLGRLEWHRLQV